MNPFPSPARSILTAALAAATMTSGFAQPPVPLIQPAGAPPAPAVPVDNSYVIKPNDVLSVSVFEEADLSGTVPVIKSGQASFALIGSVDVGGLSVADATAKVKDLYARDYLVDPKISLTVSEYAVDLVIVSGSVNVPGNVQIPAGGLDLAGALAQAGGPNAEADTGSIRLVRESGAETSYSYSQIRGAAGRIKLSAGDRVEVGKSAFVGATVNIQGPVQRPGPVSFPIDGRLDLVGAIAQAGGMTPLANQKKVTINRRGTVIEVDYRKMSQQGDKPFPLKPGDTIIVKERWF